MPRLSQGLLVALFLATPISQAPGGRTEKPIEGRLSRRIETFPGEVGLAATNLVTGESLAIRGDARFPTASLIKVAVMVEAYHQIADGRLRRETVVTLAETDKAGDETVPLNMMHAGLNLTVADLLNLMIVYSDNTATNMLVRLLKTAEIDRRMASYGLANTKIFRPTFRDGHADVFPEEEREFGLGMTTPREMTRLFEWIVQGKIVSRAICEEMLAILGKQRDRAMIPRSLPIEQDRIFVANKTGWDEEKLSDAKGFKGEIRTDAAYVNGPKARYVITICIRRGKDTRATVDNEALRTGAELSRMIYEYWSLPPRATGSTRNSIHRAK